MYKEHACSIDIVDEVEFKIPIAVTSVISSKTSKIIENDQTPNRPSLTANTYSSGLLKKR